MRQNGGEARTQVAAALHQLRVEAGLSTYQLATRMGLSQSKVTRMETGRSGAVVADVEAWAAATVADPARAMLLVRQAERARIEAIALRRGGPRESTDGPVDDAGQLEHSAALMLTYHPVVIPDLLRTAEYARRELRANQSRTPGEISAAVAALVGRQAVLFDDSKRFEVILGEPALRWRVGPPAVQLAQLDRIRTLATLTNVVVGILPMSARLPVVGHGFAIYAELAEGGTIALVETLGRLLKVDKEWELDRYREAFGHLRASALTGELAMAIVGELMSELSASMHQT